MVGLDSSPRPLSLGDRSAAVVECRAAESIGLAGLTPHELRHTAASLAVAEGANVKAVQRMLGHASAAMTLDVYADLFEDDLDQVADRSTGRRLVRLRTQCGLRASAPILTPFVRVVGTMPEQGVCVVGRAGLEPATEGL
ncbi:tyrosine-type recombinase/integrase [Micromonospora purpureochromogenes]|uniref:tyrosine-type recombinase/integrase n=1 Tax=Micromonospora purpureochromogenes TaxID=47872 RepID=UPI00331A5347